ncbi:NAD(P)-binding domain-containing protein [Cellulomonas sp. ES6]|uniref:NAD(P)-binding domain-containing protein n=1 Tax=Cellulomonas sp. ES6 TaxID=3039384 RepID=UPI0024B678A0|nr:NAD(P)-binding domain-containing protein [Cellulomonas sp. ES6]WHP19287.1 NAD(P)-binding domain-containing protein [Cellulomonas sp. ES6]
MTPTDAVADVVVVGAGQAGLAVAAHLARSGFVPAGTSGGPTYVVLDAAPGPGGAWRERWPGLTMRTVNGVYELPGRALPDFPADEPASAALTRYFGDYEQELGLAVRRPVQVRAVRDDGGLLAVETVERPGAGDPDAAPRTVPTTPAALATRPGTPARGTTPDAPPDPDDGLGCGVGAARAVPGPAPAPDLPPDLEAPVPARRRTVRTWHARALVNATGTWTRPFWPSYPGRDVFAGTQLHTHDYRTPEELAGRRVLVVGGGISAVQHLLAIHPHAASMTWVTRRPPDWRDEEFSPELGRAAVARVEERTRAGLPPGSIVSATGLPLTPEYRAGIAAGVLRARPVFTRLVADGAVWDDATARGPLAAGWVTGPVHETADVVLWATGFRPALDHLRPLGLRNAEGGIVVDGTQVVADPRVQLVGYGPSASTVGANRAGREAVRRVRALLGV